MALMQAFAQVAAPDFDQINGMCHVMPSWFVPSLRYFAE